MMKFSNIIGEHEFEDGTEVEDILLHFKNPEFFEKFYLKNLELTKKGIKESVRDDVLISQAVNSFKELDKSINLLVKRLREWYDLYNPETSRSIGDHEKFVDEITAKDKDSLLGELRVSPKDSLGADIAAGDVKPIMLFAKEICSLYGLRKSQMEYMDLLMERFCPNVKAVCDVLVGAKLIEHAGSLKKLSEMPASKIQILGAEKSLFRHMKTGSRPPRHGIIAEHPLIVRSPERMHGKVARTIADKVSIASKVDYFRGSFIGDKLRKDIEEKFKQGA